MRVATVDGLRGGSVRELTPLQTEMIRVPAALALSDDTCVRSIDSSELRFFGETDPVEFRNAKIGPRGPRY